MRDYVPTFDRSVIDTPARMNPTVALDDITRAPATGTGLTGAAYAPGTSIRSITQLQEIVASRTPDATFTATSLYYASRESETTLTEFLREDGASVEGDGGLEMGPSGLTMTGYIFIPEGVHEIAVDSDDGFSLSIGGRSFTEFEGTRAPDETARVAEFEGGLYKVEIAYFDAGGGMKLNLQIDGVTVDQSALYQSPEDFLNPPADVATIPIDDYHPSLFVEASLDGDEAVAGSSQRDVIEGDGGDDLIDGGRRADEIKGGYGDDSIEGGAGDDVIDGGRGSDLISGGDGDDLLISRSDAGEQRIGQLAVGNPTRPDPDGEVNAARQKLIGYENQALTADDVLIGGEGRDTFLFAPQINAKLDIIEKHVRSDGTINWGGVAGENDELHDHWVDSFGIDVIADFNREEDSIAVIGHTASICDIEYRDVNNDGYEETIITISSDQSGPCVRTGEPTCACVDGAARSGGAHDQDLLGQIIVYGDKVTSEDIKLNAGVTYGIVETIAEVNEALFPPGETKVSTVNGQTIYGYDTRGEDGSYGAITGAPEDFFENKYFDEVEVAAPQPEAPELTRAPFAPLETIDVAGQVKSADAGAQRLAPSEAGEAGLPGALGYWRFDGARNGIFSDERDGPGAAAYTLYENQALLRTDGGAGGPGAAHGRALTFNGKDEFAFIQHDDAYNVSQGTIALWVKPDDLSGTGMIVSKDASGAGDGGHFRLGHLDGGNLFLRFAEGDGRSNQSWSTSGEHLKVGQWSHVAVNFTESGVAVFVNGQRVPNNSWRTEEGDGRKPAQYQEAYLIGNDEPWVLGADTSHTKVNGTAAMFATDNSRLKNAYEGSIADFGVWGGFEKTDALTVREIRSLIEDGPGAALTNPSGVLPMAAGDDHFSGGRGRDTLLGEAGDDTLKGQGGRDSLEGGYGDDSLHGGAGRDTLDGGRGSDLLKGGNGNDLLRSTSDAGEQRAGQLVLGEPSRPFPDPSIDEEYLKLIDWTDQSLVADDILVGGKGRDHFYFETHINAKLDILQRHVNDDRTIDWMGVAGENRRIHDHWVDHLGIDVIADYNADEDRISVVGHTTQVSVDYKLVDRDGDGVDDDVVSIITAYSQQGGGGGAHDEDLLGYIVVHGDMVDVEDITISPKVHYGVVDTIDEAQEALAPTGETKRSEAPQGQELFGYDSRDVEGDPIAVDPEAFAENPYADEVVYGAGSGPDEPLGLISYDEGGVFRGDGFIELDHATGEDQANGAWAFSFTADEVGGMNQALLSKDRSGFEDGGHLTIWIDQNGRLLVRFQSKTDSIYLRGDETIEAGEAYHVAFSFSKDTVGLYVNGLLVDAEDGFTAGMLGNLESTLLGVSGRLRNDRDDRLEWFFEGEIGEVAVFDRPLTGTEALLLAGAGGDPDVLSPGAPNLERAPLPALSAPEAPDTMISEQSGGAGDDLLVGTSGADLLRALGGDDELLGRGGDDFLRGGGGDDFLNGAGGADTLVGGKGDDHLIGRAKADELYGGDASDTLEGGAGADILIGGLGRDHLYGGGGADVFGFGADGMRDIVYDFQNGVDLFAISGPTSSFGDLNIRQINKNVLVAYEGGSFWVKDGSINQLDVSDFVF